MKSEIIKTITDAPYTIPAIVVIIAVLAIILVSRLRVFKANGIEAWFGCQPDAIYIQQLPTLDVMTNMRKVSKGTQSSRAEVRR